MMIYNKPLIHYLISQLLLVGIKIQIVGKCPTIDLPDIKISYAIELNYRFTKNAFVIYGNQFLYGPNLTKHFQRAMSRDDITVMAAMKAKGKYGLMIDRYKHAKLSDEYSINKYYALPFAFIPKENTIDNFEKVICNKVCVETLVRGMVHFNISDGDCIYQMAGFIKMMDNIGEKITDVLEIIERRKIEG